MGKVSLARLLFFLQSALFAPPSENSPGSLLISSRSRSVEKVKGERVAHSNSRLSHAALTFSQVFHVNVQDWNDFRSRRGLICLLVSAPRPPETSCFPSLRPNIDTRTVPAAWQGSATGSSYRFIPPSCDLSSVRFRSGRIQNLRVDWKAEQDVVEVHREGEGSGRVCLTRFATGTFSLEGSRECRRYCEAWEPMRPAQPQNGKTDKAPNSLGHG